MLKIERKSRDLLLRLRETRSDLISRPFLLALAIALGIHLSTYALFRFPIFKPRYDAPNKVLVIQTEPLDGQLVANLTTEPSSEPEYLLPKTSSPSKILTTKPRRLLSYTSVPEELFSAIERPLTEPIFSLPPVAQATRLYVSGPLAEYEMDQTAALGLANTTSLSQRVRFAVEVDARYGKIHWYESLEPKEDTTWAEKLLQELVFFIPNQHALVTGEIEVALHD